MSRGRRRGLACVAALAGLGAGPVQLPSPTDEAWEPLRFPSIDTATEYRAVADAPGVLEAESRCGASARVLPLRDFDLTATPRLSWRWRVLRPLEIQDERTKAGDDFAARIYVMFAFEPEKAGWFERTTRSVGESLYGKQLPGAALSFVWASGAKPGESWISPYTSDSMMVALANGSGDDWRDESVDVVAAYRKAFGAEPPRPIALGIMSDADNACQHGRAQFSDFRFSPPPAPDPESPAP